MAILEHEVRSLSQSPATGLYRRLFTRDEYYTLGKAGILHDDRVELIEGEIIEMAPIGPPHSVILHPLAVILEKVFGSAFNVRNQVPISLGNEDKPSEPQPDLAIVTGSWRDYISRHPNASEIKLLVEIADSSLAYDRQIKAALYATSGIPEYWIVNLIDRQLEVYREPSETGYASTVIYNPGETVQPLLAEENGVAVADFMP